MSTSIPIGTLRAYAGRTEAFIKGHWQAPRHVHIHSAISYCSVEVEWHDGKRTNHPWEGEMIAVRSKPGEISLTKPLAGGEGPTLTRAPYETSPSA